MMNENFKIQTKSRPGVPPGLAGTPLYSVVWRYLKSHYRELEDETSARYQSAKSRREALTKIALEVYQMQKNDDLPPAMTETVQRLRSLLEALDTHILAPDGEAYDEGMMEVLDNLVVHPDPAYRYPVIKETVTPTIFCEGELIQRGKAVIGVPLLDVNAMPGVDDRE